MCWWVGGLVCWFVGGLDLSPNHSTIQPSNHPTGASVNVGGGSQRAYKRVWVDRHDFFLIPIGTSTLANFSLHLHRKFTNRTLDSIN